ncbi:hypothetical protein RhiirA1_429595 [Rhizophagus irregularis]|uniref:Uncharacterized protein n=1 Tax=Rhizophagus irregularis TaxID=588596 RepID=A0A2N0QWH2_9GLOM|nr:hypothetical protein RhiirA1_429595 [Rhizophagus irregularis]
MAKTIRMPTVRIKQIVPGLVVLASHAIFYIGAHLEKLELVKTAGQPTRIIMTRREQTS